jgi:aminoglycoside/choline kinase family phosphotransferase
MNKLITQNLEKIFKDYTGLQPEAIHPLPQGGSDRKYFRIEAKDISFIGAHNPDVEENRAFFYLTNHFFSLGFPVAQLLSISCDESTYLVSDLGDLTLFHKLTCTFWERDKANATKDLLKKSLRQLAKLQIEGAKGLNFSKCFPKSEFDLQSVMWDFNYFKYCFLKPSGIRFNEAKLDNDFLAFTNLLLSQPCNYFHYRDFQSRNIMLVNDEPYLIDYQGGRKGPLLYDVASFLYQARANFPQWLRDELLEFYLEEVEKLTNASTEELKSQFPNFALFRVIQTLGAYGYRGFFERRAHFLQSIPYAAANLNLLFEKISIKLPHLNPILKEVFEKYGSPTEQTDNFNGLTIDITSFSFKKGYPLEHAEHGGGFVFDCRALPNPGRLDKYKMLTGLDKPVIDFLNKHVEAEKYFQKVYSIVKESVDAYIDRGFNFLSVSFGCTGGQHRSVYMASRLARLLEKENGVRLIVIHRELNQK